MPGFGWGRLFAGRSGWPPASSPSAALERGVPVALAATARLAFLIFWPGYVASALTSLFGSAFSSLREHARELGLAFAAALILHLGLVACNRTRATRQDVRYF